MGIKGQTVVEYTVLIGIITVALFYMGPLFKRGVQSLVKVAGDQIGDQRLAEQDIVSAGGEPRRDGYLKGSTTQTTGRVSKKIETPGFGGVADITVNDISHTTSQSTTDLGDAR